jgi:hypothetical protein
LLIFPVSFFAQHAFRPIIGSAVACSYYTSQGITRYFAPDSPEKYIEEEMPAPEIELNEIEGLLVENVLLNELFAGSQVNKEIMMSIY